MNKSHAILIVLHVDKLYLACGGQYLFSISFVIFLFYLDTMEILLSFAATIMHKDYYSLSNSNK